MSTPPGWFPNPSNSDEEVYWDGEKWTGDVRPVFARQPNMAGLPDVGEDPAAGLPTTEVKPEKPRKKHAALWLSLAAVLLLLIGGGATVIVVANNVHAQQVAEQKAAAAKKKADAERAAEAAAAAKQAADDAKRAERAQTVTQVEASIKKMAEDDVVKGIIDGPVIGVTCNPVSGSTDDLTDPTTTFDCFVANKDNGDGTQSGYFFNATVNWTSGQYTYGLGKSGS
jgi:hypothetical protein